MVITSELVVQRQLEAYNRHDLENFLSTYDASVQILRFPTNEVMISGLDQLRSVYGGLFGEGSTLHAEITSRTVQQNFVIDKEHVTGMPGNETVDAIAIYEIRDNLIIKVWFIL